MVLIIESFHSYIGSRHFYTKLLFQPIASLAPFRAQLLWLALANFRRIGLWKNVSVWFYRSYISIKIKYSFTVKAIRYNLYLGFQLWETDFDHFLYKFYLVIFSKAIDQDNLYPHQILLCQLQSIHFRHIDLRTKNISLLKRNQWTVYIIYQ